MSEPNAQIVRTAYGHLNSMDAEALIAMCDLDFKMDMSGRVFNPETYEGADGVREFVADVAECWESYRWNVEQTRTADASVVALLHCEARGRDGMAVDWRVAWLWTFRGARPVSVRFFRDQSDALKAAGLQE